MNKALAAAAALALTLPAAPALSSPVLIPTAVTIQNIVGTFSDPTVGPGTGTLPTTGGAGTATPTVRWGTTTGQQSGYDFIATGAPIETTVPPTPSADFALGDFKHLNFVISQPFLTGVVLTLTAEILIDGNSQGTRNFVFNVQHTETPNGDPQAGGNCPFGGANGQGININGCADRVRITTSDTTEIFIVGDQKLTLNIKGFQVDGNFTTEFFTIENQVNDAVLIANVSLAAIPVPTPMSLALFATGLLGLAAAGRSRKA
jgi:hypothetical protein